MKHSSCCQRGRHLNPCCMTDNLAHGASSMIYGSGGTPVKADQNQAVSRRDTIPAVQRQLLLPSTLWAWCLPFPEGGAPKERLGVAPAVAALPAPVSSHQDWPGYSPSFSSGGGTTPGPHTTFSAHRTRDFALPMGGGPEAPKQLPAAWQKGLTGGDQRGSLLACSLMEGEHPAQVRRAHTDRLRAPAPRNSQLR